MKEEWARVNLGNEGKRDNQARDPKVQRESGNEKQHGV